MPAGLKHLTVRNYRNLADVSMPLGTVSVFFGPNGSGKSTLLDTLWFFRDCAIRGVEVASSERNHGIGLLWDRAEGGEQITVSLSTDMVEYELRFGLSSGRIEPFAGERLRSLATDKILINRTVGSDKAQLFNATIGQQVQVPLREPEKLTLSLYLDFNHRANEEGTDLDHLLHFVRFYHSRSFFLFRLKKEGSEANPAVRLWDRGDNLWSVLRNLHDRKSIDDRYDTIVRYMRDAFPSFDGLRLEQTGPATVYAHFQERGRNREIYASGVSDGHLQMLLLLTALFSEGRGRSTVLLFDEPEVSLHPGPLAVFAKAVMEAATDWDKQILLATHSPVLLSQFAPDDILATEVDGGCTRIRRLSEMDEIKDLLEDYAAGSLYMAQVIGGQGSPGVQGTER